MATWLAAVTSSWSAGPAQQADVYVVNAETEAGAVAALAEHDPNKRVRGVIRLAPVPTPPEGARP